MLNRFLRSVIIPTACLIAVSSIYAGDIKRRFVATDESGKQLIYVDQIDPTKDWTVPLQGNRDLQLTKSGTVVVSVPAGYREYSLDGGKLLKDVKVGTGIQSIIRLENGHTLLASKKQVIELDVTDKTVVAQDLAFGGFFRLLRLTKEGNFVHVSGKSEISERTRDGQVVRTLDVAKLTPDTSKPYSMEEMSDGTFIVSTGYGSTILYLDKDWNLLRSIGGKGKVEGISLHFFADFQRLTNGNLVVVQWSGHKRQDSKKAPQVLEFDKDGKVVWAWHDPKRAGSLHGIEVIE